MSTTPSPNVERTIEHCRPKDVTPVWLEVDALESTAPEYLRELKRELAEAGYVPTGLRLEARFDAECSLETQEEADRIRNYVRAAAFLGATSVSVEIEQVDDESKAQPALAACAERARREGLSFEVDGPFDLS
jgi:sugar phosphate isomerase/epimerase